MPPPDDDDIPVADPLPAADPVPPADDLPVAVPVAAPRPPAPRRERPAERPAARPVSKELKPAEPVDRSPKPRLFAACCVIGCLGGAAVAGVGFLLFVGIVLLGRVGDEVSKGTDKETPGVVRGPRPEPIQRTKAVRGSLDLPDKAPATAVCRGGSGRFLLIRTSQQLSVFDPNTGDFVAPFRFEPPEPNLVFAAGASKLFVHRQGTLQRYNLVSRQLELTVPWPKPPAALAIGAASDGPLFAFTPNGENTDLATVDADQLRQSGQVTIPRYKASASGRNVPRVSNDGLLIGLGDGPGRAGVVRQYAAGAFTPFALNPPVIGHVAPSPDGRFVYTPAGVYDPEGKGRMAPAAANRFFYTLPPAHGGDFFLSLDASPKGILRNAVRLHLAGNREVIGEFEGVRGPAGLSADDALDTLSADQRVHFWPAAGLVAVLPITPPRVDLYPVDVSEMLKKSEREYLAFESDPPTAATRGQTYRYRPQVWSNGPRQEEFDLVRKPDGMRVENGTVVWQVPADPQPEYVVELTADNGSASARQVYRIVIAD